MLSRVAGRKFLFDVCLKWRGNDPFFRDNGRNQLVIRHIKCGIINLGLFRRSWTMAEMSDFLRPALLNGNLAPALDAHVKGRLRRHHKYYITSFPVVGGP